jgi:hypothetical protein
MRNLDDTWFRVTEQEIEQFQINLDPVRRKKLRIDTLLRAARSTSGFPDCPVCTKQRVAITSLIAEIPSINTGSRDAVMAYLRSVNSIVDHLRRKHSMISEGEYTGAWLAIGTGIGVAFGASFGQIAIGLPVGIAVGLAVGALLDSQARRQGRIL